MRTYLGIKFNPRKASSDKFQRAVLFSKPDNPKDHITYVDANNYREEGSWYVYEKNGKILSGLKNKLPDLFVYRQISLTNAIKKSVYWKNYREGILEFIGEKIFTYEEKFYETRLYPHAWTICFLKYVRYVVVTFFKYFKHWSLQNNFNLATNGSNYFVYYLNDDFEYNLVEKLIVAAKHLNPLIFLPSNHKLSLSKIQKLAEVGIPVVIGKQRHALPRLINFFKLKKAEFNLLNLILEDYPIYIEITDNFLELAKNRLKGVFILAAENLPQGHLLADLGTKFNIPVFNAMNGTKASTANNADACFTRWFVWDEKMKELLIKGCFLSPEQFFVSGHLAQDEIVSHKFSYSIPITENEIREFKIISVFTPKDKRPNKVNGLEVLYKLWKENKDWIILYRPHPFEKVSDYILPEPFDDKRLIVVKYDDSTSKKTLYDQLIISDLAIVFGSTVAIEASWAGLKCITYEEAEKSIIYAVDGKKIIHVNNKDSLQRELVGLQKRKNFEKSNVQSTLNKYLVGIEEKIK